MIRFFDFLISLLGIITLLPILIIIFFVGLFVNGSPIFKQERIGYNKKIFLLIKFRTMKIGTDSVATHKVDNSAITQFGFFLRLTKIDEIPQLFNVLKGEMSLVGPRPSLSNQFELINERTKRNIYQVKPGITGLAQVSGINMETPTLLAETDFKMINHMNLAYYFFYIIKTLLIIFKKRV